MTEYSAKIGRTLLDYSIEGDILRCRCRAQPSFSFEVTLDDPSMHLKPARKFRVPFQLGIVGLIAPIWTFSGIFLKRGRLDISALGWPGNFLSVCFLVGIVLVWLYRRPLKGSFVTSDNKAGIVVWRDPAGIGDFEGFISAIRAKIQGNS